MSSSKFTHLDADGKPTMVDVSNKAITKRVAKAQAVMILPEVILEQFAGQEISTKKGAVFQTAILAGIMGAKKTSDLIPLCHPLPLNKVNVDIRWGADKEVIIECTAVTEGKTGVEMEALTGASTAALTVYDMCKAFSQNIIIKDIRLLEKTGGKTDFKYKND